jgi:hypothetical protein
MDIVIMREAKTRIEKSNPRVVNEGIILVSECIKEIVVAGLKDDRIKYRIFHKE